MGDLSRRLRRVERRLAPAAALHVVEVADGPDLERRTAAALAAAGIRPAAADTVVVLRRFADAGPGRLLESRPTG
jgi:hypothetical protein